MSIKEHLTVKRIGGVAVLLFIIFWLIGWYWSLTPAPFNVKERVAAQAQDKSHTDVPGYTLTTTMIMVTEELLNKPGGYLSNDKMPPGLLLDNMPAFEFGVLEMTRDLALSMRKDFTRSQSQSVENPRIAKAVPQFNMDHTNWAFPAAESSYQKGIDLMYRYRQELVDPTAGDSQFYTRADNLREWLKLVEKRMGSYSQRLSASVGSARINTDMAGQRTKKQSSEISEKQVKTSWWKTDDVFYEAKGASWALLQYLKAAEIEFRDVLEDKNALVSLRQIIRELEATQHTVWSPMILNGDGFGMLANHSLVMANYISRANAALIELSELMSQG